MRQEIGITELQYNSKGALVYAGFVPTIRVELDKTALEEFSKIPATSEKIKETSDLTMATYFTQMNDFELADRLKYRIVSEMDECIKYSTGTVKLCRLKYFFEEI